MTKKADHTLWCVAILSLATGGAQHVAHHVAATRLAILSMQIDFGRGAKTSDGRQRPKKAKPGRWAPRPGRLEATLVYEALKELVAPVLSGADMIIMAPNSFRLMSSIVSIVSSSIETSSTGASAIVVRADRA